jgi:hypothetical protein
MLSADLPVTVNTGERLTIKNVKFLRVADSSVIPEIAGVIVNPTPNAWSSLALEFAIVGHCGFKIARWNLRIFVTVIPGDNPFKDSIIRLFGEVDGCVADTYEVAFVSAIPVPSASLPFVIDREKDRRAGLEADFARQRALEQLPYISTLSTAAFVAADEKCAIDYASALRIGGLDGRKRVAELVTYHCGFLVDNGTRVAIQSREGLYSVVKIVDGKSAGELGWILSRSLKFPE